MTITVIIINQKLFKIIITSQKGTRVRQPADGQPATRNPRRATRSLAALLACTASAVQVGINEGVITPPRVELWWNYAGIVLELC